MPLDKRIAIARFDEGLASLAERDKPEARRRRSRKFKDFQQPVHSIDQYCDGFASPLDIRPDKT
jgi:hypothetical protein